ncbi:hypothetical protein EES40_30090 [Streptomyces sp. ADI93-02]|nr:hypothetical protein EES40_30090 [Streptomyces sp. ADI93-02]
MQCTPESSDRPLRTPTSSAVVVVAGRAMCRDRMPAFAHRARFMRTYVTDAGPSPTSTVARQGLAPVRRAISAALAAVSSTVRAARPLPSMSWAVSVVDIVPSRRC